MDVSVRSEILGPLLDIEKIDRLSLTKEQRLIYKTAYKDITGRFPNDGCGTNLCRGIWHIVHNWLAKYHASKPKANVKVVQAIDFDALTVAELKQYATMKGIEFAKNAGKAKMIELIKNAV